MASETTTTMWTRLPIACATDRMFRDKARKGSILAGLYRTLSYNLGVNEDLHA